MYDELVKVLRKTDFSDGCTCGAEPLCKDKDCVILQAADAIEQLSNTGSAYGRGWTLGYDAGREESKPRWIPVTEGLPKTRESILGKKSSKVIVAFRFDDGIQGTDTAHTLNGEWVFEDHITVVARTITHWMPLPEPPKEET